ncbi:mechanosensitive ion channel family protein [Pontiella sulfatireligans]|uniref:Mechanosensing system component YbdG n=1 Tax=Pontiella sulfatireligans TaxID=2750658 RepID=A0A6C2UT85_9BACT|nr:mechanosensitive ion channel family protein [Pontiella sulfatireligans]VGO23359.1 Miniconductance mechanosensitive channel YbdG [Pontiella sulfatireligans]
MLMTNIQDVLVSAGIETKTAGTLAVAALMLLIAAGAYLVYWVLRNYLLKLIHSVVTKTSNTWDDELMDAGVFQRFLRLIPLTFIAVCIDRAMPGQFALLKRILFAVIIFAGVRAVEAFISAASDIYHDEKSKKRKPIRPLFQTLTIVLYLLSGIFIVSVLLNKSPWNLFGLMGGLTAVTMLVFKDTILGFVAGIQLSANDMVREGDWIEMPKYGADGDVIEVAVNTVKVRNWDKTITTIPTYALISDSFKNWRGMSESGGRRIKRNICIDMNTVRFADEEMLEKFRGMELLKEYVEKRQEEINAANSEQGIDLSATVVNGRRQTNLGIFRAYLVEYLRGNPKIHKGMTFLVRHLQPTPQGLPIEIYVFSSDKIWANYESIQADIFDHILASLPEFGLRVYQQPSGNDVLSLKSI